MDFNSGSATTIIYWNLEEKEKVNLYVKTHNEYVKPYGIGDIPQVGGDPKVILIKLKFRTFSLRTSGTVCV